MDQKAFNERIVMSLLRQCAWVWEHCTANPNEGEFNLTEVLQGFGKHGYKSKPGIVVVDMNQCEYWGVFNSHLQPIDGLTYDRETDEARLEFDGFRCSYLLHDVLHLTARFCKAICPSMAQKVRFCYKDGERWTEMPEKRENERMKKSKNEAKRSNGTTERQNPEPLTVNAEGVASGTRERSGNHEPKTAPTFAEMLRQVLLAA